ncbi:hypothetical protein MOJ79_16305 [Calidifontimicrobium sp. SYSU G02091]|uniref:hypothetical protein n=1 Tax=Calidifontimicrobium sp. SYSU G02091 TaxID=2926421 RepID=UPI001F531DC9|nr:hypothetical protein [Calidifontimicrobium sp. SYSU G02091]MCI1193397.1 hypothetical protein [Calidifontimicrobium sp. SYSU G02091]
MSAESLPGWLVAEVAEGIQRLLVLRLEGCPPADAVEAVALAWADAIVMRGGLWDEALDAPRLRAAFRHLAAHVTRWPAPSELWQHMPARPQPPALDRPAPAPQDKERILALLQQARRRLVRS